MTNDQAIDYLSTGANLTIGIRKMEDLERMAEAARASGAHLTIVGEVAMDWMLRIARAGGSHLTFDIASYKVKD